MNTNLNKISKLLSQCRKNICLTQAEVGDMVGVQKAMVSKVENGLCVNFNTINRIAEAFNVEPMVELRSTKKVNKNTIDYIMTAIIEFAKRHTLTIREASNNLNRFKGIDFLTEFYDVEHTMSFNDCVDDHTMVCRSNEMTWNCLKQYQHFITPRHFQNLKISKQVSISKALHIYLGISTRTIYALNHISRTVRQVSRQEMPIKWIPSTSYKCGGCRYRG